MGEGRGGGEVEVDIYLGFIRYGGLIRKLNLRCFKYCVFFQYCSLRLIMSKWFLAVQTLIENNSYAPDVHLGRNLRRILTDHKTFRWQIPTKKNRVNASYV